MLSWMVTGKVSITELQIFLVYVVWLKGGCYNLGTICVVLIVYRFGIRLVFVARDFKDAAAF